MNTTLNVIQELGLDSLPREKQEELTLKIGDIINQKILIRALDEMSDQQKDEFDAFLGDEKNDQAATFNFLRSKVKNFDDLARDEIELFKKSSVDFINSIK